MACETDTIFLLSLPSIRFTVVLSIAVAVVNQFRLYWWMYALVVCTQRLPRCARHDGRRDRRQREQDEDLLQVPTGGPRMSRLFLLPPPTRHGPHGLTLDTDVIPTDRAGMP